VLADVMFPVFRERGWRCHVGLCQNGFVVGDCAFGEVFLFWGKTYNPFVSDQWQTEGRKRAL
jgi:hypothetical protein